MSETKSVDYYSRSGAHVLAERVRKHWAAQGHDVTVRVVEVPPGPRGGRVREWLVQTDLLGGLPRSALPASPHPSPAEIVRHELAAERLRQSFGGRNQAGVSGGRRMSAREQETLRPEYIREMFEYSPETGELRWLVTPPEHFTSQRVCNWWNTRYAGAVAGSARARGYRQICIDGRDYRAHRIVCVLKTGEWPAKRLTVA